MTMAQVVAKKNKIGLICGLKLYSENGFNVIYFRRLYKFSRLEAEAAKVEGISARPIIPASLAERGAPLDGDWQSILIRSR